MLFGNTIEKTKSIYQEYPKQFWVIVGSNFIDRIGGALIFPFFALYITRKFNVGMTEVGLLFALFSVTDMLGNMVGGAMTDYLGRKTMIILGLVVSALTSLGMGPGPAAGMVLRDGRDFWPVRDSSRPCS